MCGIAGILRFDGGPVDTTALQRMTDSLAHRGPDGEGHYVAGSR
jgi:asparagine synthase (glutamine-hydrolysing)